MSVALNVPRISTHLGSFGTGADRYDPGGYKPQVSPKGRIFMAAGVREFRGIELRYPMMFEEISISWQAVSRPDQIEFCGDRIP